MQNSKELVTQRDLLVLIEEFIKKTDGLQSHRESDTEIKVMQKVDSKSIKLKESIVADVIFRKDTNEKDFIQINFVNGDKILLTEQLIGFKPHSSTHMDLDKLPKVVTTVDLFAVLEALEEVSSEAHSKNETDALKTIFSAILFGGERVGFDLSVEKTWFRRIPTFATKTIS